MNNSYFFTSAIIIPSNTVIDLNRLSHEGSRSLPSYLKSEGIAKTFSLREIWRMVRR